MTETMKGFVLGLLFGVVGTACVCKRYYDHVIEETIQAEREQAEKNAEQAREEATDKNAEHYYNEMRMYNNLVDKYGVGILCPCHYIFWSCALIECQIAKLLYAIP